MNNFKIIGLSGGSFVEHLATLGLLKVINRQLDRKAKGYWKNNIFHLESSKTQEEIVDFFVNEYSPLPLFCVWDNNSNHQGIVESLDEDRYSSQIDDYNTLMSIRNDYDGQYDSTKKLKIKDNKNKSVQGLTAKKEFLARLYESTESEEIRDIICSLCTPYEYNGVKQVSFTILGNSNGGFIPGCCKTIDQRFWNSVLKAKDRHYESTLFSQPHANCLEPECLIPYLDTYGNYADQSQFGIGNSSSTPDSITWNGQKVNWGSDPVLTILAIEGMTFFRGRLGNKSSHESQLKGVDFDESVAGKESYVKTLPMTVVNNSVSFAFRNWDKEGILFKNKEIWAPMWERPMTYRRLLIEIRNLSEVAQSNQVTFTDSFDMMNFLSKKGRENGVSIFSRYLFAPRQGREVLVTIPVERFDCRTEIRSDVLTCFLPALKKLRSLVSKDSMNAPKSVLKKYEVLENEVNLFMANSSSVTRISNAFIDLTRQMNRSSLESDEFRFKSLWLDELFKENDNSEFRIAYSLATNNPHSTLHDIAAYLNGDVSDDNIERFKSMIEMCDLSKEIPFGVTKGETPWLPMDYVIGALLKNHQVSDINQDSKDIRTWHNLINYNRNEDAMANGIRRLRLRGVIKYPMSVFTETSSENMIKSVQVPLSECDTQRLCQLVS